MNQAEFEKFRAFAFEQHARGVEDHHIESNLAKEGAHENVVKHILGELKALNLIRRRKRGFKLIFIGSFLLVFGFLLTLLLFHSNVCINYAMYGLTMTGIVLLLWGMVDLMGW